MPKEGRNNGVQTVANRYEKRLIRVMDHNHDHPDGDLSLDALADVAALNRFHFHRVFHTVIGLTTAQIVRRVRLHRASIAQVTTTDPVARIAGATGYPNLASFTRAFTELYSLPPAAFRKRGELRPPIFTFTSSTVRTGEPLMYPVTIRHDPARRLAAMPHKGSYFEIARAFDKLGATLASRGLFAQGGHMVGVYYDDPAAFAAADLASHAGFELPVAAPVAPPLEEVRLAAGPHAVLTYTGPYSGLPAAYDQLYRNWLPTSGRQPADSPMFEVYLNSPLDTAPEALVTEICMPLTLH